ncbi:DUF2076 domain-containing protein [Allopusillimonas ginsengisoli]|uniref:DUF2076 domain-containing protein n=1 Tax=Allopusillimonas ginsengisoli TaxID=453575 RepID=UPI0039C1D053
MNPQDRNAIESVFNRIQEVEQQGGQRDNDAEQLIHDRLQKQPGSAYYLAQTVLIQEQALKNAQQRIQELEKSPSASTSGAALSSGGFGRQPAPTQRPASTPSPSGFGRNHPGAAGGGFMAGALQTAMGVAGGVMLGNMLGGLFSGNDAQAGELPPEETPAQDEPEQDHDYASDDGGFDDL